MLLGGANIPYLLREYRVGWIRGRYGVGKTLLAYALWYLYFRRMGYRLFCNFAAWGASSLEDLRPDASGRLRAYIIIDEGGDWLTARRRVIYAARKLDYILVVSGRAAPPREVQELTIVGRYSLESSGIPLVRYTAVASAGGIKDHYNFWLFLPWRFWGMYSTRDLSSDPGPLIDTLSRYARGIPEQLERINAVVEAVKDALEG